jgi:hypothetical protein
MPEDRIRVAPNTVAYADRESHKLVVEFAIPGAPTETIDVKILEDSVHLTAPARDIEYVSALALGWPVKPEGTSKNRRFPRPRKSDSRFSYSERGRLAWDSLASSI